MGVAIGIDLGGTKIAGAVVADDGRILARTVIPTETRNETTLVSGVAKVALELRASAPGAIGIGIGAAGLIDREHGVIVTSPNLPTRDLGLASMIEARTGLVTRLDNDANAAAFAEARIGAGVGASSVIVLTIGTGLGGGVVVDGRLLRGAHGFAGEIGHVVLDRTGPQCACGQRGCFESYVSGRAIEQRGADAVGNDLGLGLVTLSNLLDPQRFVIGGGAGIALFDELAPSARDVYEAGVLGAGARPVAEIVPATLGVDAGVIGAALSVLVADEATPAPRGSSVRDR